MKIIDIELEKDWYRLRTQVGIGLPSDQVENTHGKEVIEFVERFTEILEDNNMHEEIAYDLRTLVNFAFGNSGMEYLSFGQLGEALVFVSIYWQYADELIKCFTPIEYKIYAEALSQMIAEQQLAAQDTTRPEKNLA